LIIQIGIDDFDTRRGGCTTHLAFLIVKNLFAFKGKLLDYPRLIRLNPDVPWKTRGNGAVALLIDIPHKKLVFFKRKLRQLTIDYYNIESNTNPGIVILYSKVIPDEFKVISENARKKLVSLGETISILNKYNDKIDYWFFGNGRGLIGAVSALGESLLKGDYTYELLAYRPLDIKSRERYINAEKLIDKDSRNTFSNYDYENRKLLISPHGPDPVLCGIRGESPFSVYRDFKKIRISGRIEGWMIFVTNQGTSDLLYKESRLCEVTPYTQISVSGYIKDPPMTEAGGHVLLRITDETGIIDVMIYEPSGKVRNLARLLSPGDHIHVVGGIKPKNNTLTINTEVLYYIDAKKLVDTRPICPKCHSYMVSLGKSKGHYCKKCNYHINFDSGTSTFSFNKYPLIILPPLRSIKHVAKPLKRLGREHKKRRIGISFNRWIGIFS
jgi:tRNA(Ile2)-agmatinylcytidine synthase